MSIMNYQTKPHFIIKKNLQKSKQTGVYFSDVVTPDVLADVCYRITGTADFSYEYVDNDYSDLFLEPTYNKGRLALMHYQNVAHYITFSEKKIEGRNSGVQSVPTAYNTFYMNPYPNKKLYYYFLKDIQGNPETDYYVFMYRLMHTIGFQFLNENDALLHRLAAYASIEDIMLQRKENSGRNQANNSTYITKSSNNVIEIYGKTYGASKYESSMICYAAAALRAQNQRIILYELLEGNLKELPASSLEVIRKMNCFRVIPTGKQIEERSFEENDSLRSPKYIYNLLGKLGPKRCAFCGCEIPELVQGAHIWPVAHIKRNNYLSYDEKLDHAISGENGLWLCENHHKLFDTNILLISNNGRVGFKNGLSMTNYKYLDRITPYDQLDSSIMTDQFMEYLDRRYAHLVI